MVDTIWEVLTQMAMTAVTNAKHIIVIISGPPMYYQVLLILILYLQSRSTKGH